MLMALLQGAIFVGVTGSLIANGATTNGLAAGVVGWGSAYLVTKAIVKVGDWSVRVRDWVTRRSRPDAPAPQPELPVHVPSPPERWRVPANRPRSRS